VVFNLGGIRLPRGASISFQRGPNPHALYSMESFGTEKCSVKFKYVKSMAFETKVNYRRRGREKAKNHSNAF